ncbi:MAG: 4-(cytidine 5'-diphospho)-2-C-methyl-D-erythritol kinase [Puniceicoccales bacterium]|nr:4-(cytidine 5'-diphospho)-2-C-methyl-D-erythritol kinase [Puniceicoccales bacterium]
MNYIQQYRYVGTKYANTLESDISLSSSINMIMGEIRRKFISILSPAKINLFLAITGKRVDGFHELCSLFSRINLQDKILLEMDLAGPNNCSILSTGVYKIPLDKTNTMARAVDMVRRIVGFNGSVNIRIHKEIPPCSGLGGGSSNGANVFLSLLKILGHQIAMAELPGYLAKIGSDCPFFLKETPQLVSGRGDILKDLEARHVDGIRRIKFMIFKPNFDISTAWAYGQIVNNYTPKLLVRELLIKFLQNLEQGNAVSIYNDFNSLVFDHYPELKKLRKMLADRGFNMALTGSGSACLVNFNHGSDYRLISSLVKAQLGQDIFERSVTCM